MANVNGHPISGDVAEKDHRRKTLDRIKDFQQRHSTTIDASRRGEPIAPTEARAYEEARGNILVSDKTDPRSLPEQLNYGSKAKGAQMAMPKQQTENVLDYSKMKTTPKEPAFTLTYGKDGSITSTDNRKKEMNKAMEVVDHAKLEKSPGLKQGSKLGREVYDETANINRKMTRTGQEAVGAGIRAEQTYGGKAGHQTAKDTARNQEKIDKEKNKKQPVKTGSPEEIAAMNAKLLSKAKEQIAAYNLSKNAAGAPGMNNAGMSGGAALSKAKELSEMHKAANKVFLGGTADAMD